MEHTKDGESRSPAQTSAGASSGKPENRCYLCDRTYERLDHLNRHLKSHDNERAYKCPDCDKGFNRADLLNRHRAAHARVSEGEHPMRKRTEKACQACIRAKTKCDESRPCKRCKKRKLDCIETEDRRQASERSNSVSHSIDGQNITDASLRIAPNPGKTPAGYDVGTMPDANMAASIGDYGTQNQFAMAGDVNGMAFDFNYSDFFEQIMMPPVPGAGAPEAIMVPPNISNFTQDIDFSTIDFDFGTLNDQFGTPMAAPETAPQFTQQQPELAGGIPTPKSQAEHRSEAIKRSPWSWNSWIPPRGTHAFSDQPELDVQEDRVNAAHQLTSPGAQQGIHCSLDYKTRDAMIRVITQATSQKLSVSSFPSLQFLEDLIDIFLMQDTDAIDSYVHAASFDADKARTEKLLVMVARGAGYIALPPIWKMGLVLQDVVRFALGDVFEKDNSTTRELEIVQSSITWLDIGIWSGFRRNTEISSSFLQPPITMLSWSNAFSSFRYKKIVPLPDDPEDVLDEKWRAWAEQEGWKRLVFHTFLHDSQIMLVHMKAPLVTPAQMTLPAPASRNLWLAPNANAWRDAYYAGRLPEGRSWPSVLELIGDPHLLEGLESAVDKRLCQLLVTHAVAHDVFEYRQQSQVFRYLNGKRRRDKGLAHMSKMRDLCEDLTNFLTYCETDGGTPPEIMFTLHFLIMSLYVSLDDIQLFSGRAGEDEARKIYPTIRTWTEEAESKVGIWHAGQVFRYARAFQRTNLRDFYAVAVYHAALSMWVWGMVTSGTSRQSGMQTPVASSFSRLSDPRTPYARDFSAVKVALDVPEDKFARAFTQLGHGVPGIHLASPSSAFDGLQGDSMALGVGSFCTLFDSRGVMSAAAGLLRSKFPETKESLPPLVANLANLMHELGKLSG